MGRGALNRVPMRASLCWAGRDSELVHDGTAKITNKKASREQPRDYLARAYYVNHILLSVDWAPPLVGRVVHVAAAE